MHTSTDEPDAETEMSSPETDLEGVSVVRARRPSRPSANVTTATAMTTTPCHFIIAGLQSRCIRNGHRRIRYHLNRSSAGATVCSSGREVVRISVASPSDEDLTDSNIFDDEAHRDRPDLQARDDEVNVVVGFERLLEGGYLPEPGGCVADDERGVASRRGAAGLDLPDHPSSFLEVIVGEAHDHSFDPIAWATGEHNCYVVTVSQDDTDSI